MIETFFKKVYKKHIISMEYQSKLHLLLSNKHPACKQHQTNVNRNRQTLNKNATLFIHDNIQMRIQPKMRPRSRPSEINFPM